MRARISGIRSSAEWYRQMRSSHRAKVHDAAGTVVANVSYNALLWRPSEGSGRRSRWSSAGLPRETRPTSFGAAPPVNWSPDAADDAVVNGRDGQSQSVQQAPSR